MIPIFCLRTLYTFQYLLLRGIKSPIIRPKYRVKQSILAADCLHTTVLLKFKVFGKVLRKEVLVYEIFLRLCTEKCQFYD